ncbi:recombinase family protein [Chengkuizengella sediminis]|uniref:recombinase family protein n=1 Tax=Chengkuizengella sediminis TaxID=1885917 RepID=UPI00138974D8|nr:recombinase family protein [Chengkuizengella sediminis]NDI33149.1 recombinase family protein [Chengkuizengella sediminis]
MSIIGYARVSTKDQGLENQMEALNEYGCERIYSEKQSGIKSAREELIKTLDNLRTGDSLVVYKIDRLARSTFDLYKIARELDERSISLVFIKEQIDFSTPSGKLMFTMLGAIVEFERDLIKERTAEGRERAKAQGKHMGRPSQDPKKIQQALILYNERESNGMRLDDIVKKTGIPRSSIYAEVKKTKKVNLNE